MPRLSKIGAAALAAFGWTSGVSAVTANFLVIAGGAGGGSARSSGSYASGGGGGAGGYRTSAGTSGGGGSAEPTLSLNPALSYTVVVGAGGAGGLVGVNSGTNGSDSTFSTITSVGGGAGSAYPVNGVAGGSGGGSSGAGFIGGAGTANQGYAGGNSAGATAYGAGGGGGAGAVGVNGTTTVGGNGGAGVSSSINGTAVTRAGGGGGGVYNNTGTPGTGGSGGGGNAGQTFPSNGVAASSNTGSGGGGGTDNNADDSVTGGNGGSGVVIISYVGAQQFGGGVVTVSGGNTIHTFTTSGTLSPLNSLTANFLVVAGGAGGGEYWSGGGGGAGGLRSSVTNTGGGGTLESALTIDTNSIYLVTVGSGGAGAATGGSGTKGANGSNSAFLSITSTGGGAGGLYNDSNGNSGGSGGGAFSTSGAGTGGAGTTNQGFAGGNAAAYSSNSTGGGGGGGAGAVGVAGVSGTAGNGGAGVAVAITGSSVTYAGGGGGSIYTGTPGNGGSGGGANGVSNGGGAGNNGSANTGGGASGSATFPLAGGNGGSGVVIISYPGTSQQMAGGTVTVAGGNVIHTFTSSGYLTPIVLVNNSLRFRSSAGAYLNRTPATTTNRRTWTWSGWVKRGTLGTNQSLFTCYFANNDTSYLTISFTSDNLNIGLWNTSILYTSAVYRDPSAWYHIVLAIDTTQATASDRAKLYVNGTQVTAFGSTGYPAQNTDLAVNSAAAHYISTYDGTNYKFDGYMADINFVDGQALTPNSFGTFNGLGVWQPIRYGGSYGTNGFYLPFTNKTSTTTLGYDFSPNGNNWTPNNISLGSTAIQSFTSSTTWTAPTGVTSVSYLVVAGGGGGAYAGGGGAGGYQTSTLSVTPGTTYTVTVGGGGSGNTGFSDNSAKGSDSVFGSITSTGGGAGNFAYSTIISKNNGGSGGGAGFGTSGSGSGTSGQGNAGGTGDSLNAGGGGGAGAAGGNAGGGFSGNGGAGLASSISGSSVTRAGGGGGGCSANANTNFGSGGSGGGGSSSTLNGNAGTTNTGGGGGASSYNGSSFGNGGQGGSGIVIISYTNPASSTNDSMTDVPTLTSATTANYAVWNPLILARNFDTNPQTITNGNLVSQFTSNTTAGKFGGASTIGVTSGKWYCEIVVTEGGTYPTYTNFGITGDPLYNSTVTNASIGGQDYSVGWYNANGNVYRNGSSLFSGSTQGSPYTAMIALDVSAGKVYFGFGGTWINSANPASGTGGFDILAVSSTPTGQYFITCFFASTGMQGSYALNCGQQPFAYTPPAGFVALNTFNLPTPTIGVTASTTANKYMDVSLYTGNGSNPRAITGLGFQPDFVWLKNRSAGWGHRLSNAVVGANYALESNNQNAELFQNQYGYLTSFNSDGFTVTAGSTDDYYTNNSGEAYVAWQWKANGTGSSNTQGSITSTVSANTTAGFSVVTYTGTGANATVGHGLGVAPSMIMIKCRTGAASNWLVYHQSLSANGAVFLNLTDAYFAFSGYWQNTAPTSTVFSIGTAAGLNASTVQIVAYCFAQVAGYSAFGSYAGNASTDGPFVYTGFRPRFIMVKRTDVANWWQMYDTSRNTYNTADKYLGANVSDAEYTASSPNDFIDFNSNGFKIRGSNNAVNANGGTYIYMAFAENPFKYANAR